MPLAGSQEHGTVALCVNFCTCRLLQPTGDGMWARCSTVRTMGPPLQSHRQRVSQGPRYSPRAAMDHSLHRTGTRVCLATMVLYHASRAHAPCYMHHRRKSTATLLTSCSSPSNSTLPNVYSLHWTSGPRACDLLGLIIARRRPFRTYGPVLWAHRCSYVARLTAYPAGL